MDTNALLPVVQEHQSNGTAFPVESVQCRRIAHGSDQGRSDDVGKDMTGMIGHEWDHAGFGSRFVIDGRGELAMVVAHENIEKSDTRTDLSLQLDVRMAAVGSGEERFDVGPGFVRREEDIVDIARNTSVLCTSARRRSIDH